MPEERSPIIKEVTELLQNGDEISAAVARRLQLALSLETHTEVKKINGTVKKVSAVVDKNAEILEDYPSLLWLLRHRTKVTVGIIILVFVGLSLFYVSGLRAPIMEWFGLPPLIP